MSIAALNYYVNEATSAINQIEAAKTTAAALTATAHALERVALTNVFSQINTLFAGEPTLQNHAIKGSDNPVLQILDSTGTEEYRINLPSRETLLSDYYTYLTGSGYNPSSAVDANAYYAQV